MHFNALRRCSAQFGSFSRLLANAKYANLSANCRPLSFGTLFRARENAEDTAETENPVDVARLDLRVGRVVSVLKHPNADSLFISHVDLGESQPRTVIAGLVKYIGVEQLQNRLVVCLCNMRPSKMRGIVSHAMILCASTQEKVEPLELTDQSCKPGSLIVCDNFGRQPDKVLRKNNWELIASDLRVSDTGDCVFKGNSLRVDGDVSSPLTAPTLRNVPIK
ncbi:hypothetical protein GPALN_005579 [Globodera pallida]|nr:hypothetical protein GPALN_005579 [Globodera pallida]